MRLIQVRGVGVAERMICMVSKYTNPTENYITLLLLIIIVILVGIIAITALSYSFMFGMMGGMMNNMMAGSMVGHAQRNGMGMMGSSNMSSGAVSNMMM